MMKSVKLNKYFIMLLIFTLVLVTGCSEMSDNQSDAITLNESERVNVENIDNSEDNSEDDPKLAENTSMEVHYIDVGQGDSILIKQDEYAMLIDAGENNKGKEVVAYLKSQGIKKLNYVIGTHPHSDHIGGLDDVIYAFDVETVIMPNKSHTTKTFEDVLNAIQYKGLKITKPLVGDKYKLGDSNFTILGPNNNSYSNLNDYSISIRLTHQDNSFLFTGDAEKLSEQELINNGLTLKSDVFKAGHHGSNTSNTESLINEVKPKYVVIQVGNENKYGHPNEDVVERFKRHGTDIYRNDIHGTVIVQSNGSQLHFKTKANSFSNMQPHSDVKETQHTKLQSQQNSNVGNDMTYKSNKYVGHIKSKKLHNQSCHLLPNEENRVYFDSYEQARKEGYENCKVCNPK